MGIICEYCCVMNLFEIADILRIHDIYLELCLVIDLIHDIKTETSIHVSIANSFVINFILLLSYTIFN